MIQLVSTPYHKGRSREYKTLHILRESGWVCSRSAMSHSPVDVFAGKDGRTLIIQVKSGNARIRPSESIELIAWADAFGADAEVWSFKNRGPLIRKTLRTSSSRGKKESGSKR